MSGTHESRHDRWLRRLQATLLPLLLALIFAGNLTARAASWEAIDARAKNCVYRINVAVRLRVGDSFAQLTDTSPRSHYPVFALIPEDKGFRVVGYGSCFPIQTNQPKETFFVTNHHVVYFAEGMVQEAQRFFAALRLHAESTAAFGGVDARYKQLVDVVNLSLKKNLTNEQRMMYQMTVDSIWDTYDHHLSIKADPKRNLFGKYAMLSQFQGESGFFIHPAGSATQNAIKAKLYKSAKQGQPDLAVLKADRKTTDTFPLTDQPLIVGQPVQAIGYPSADEGSRTVYAPVVATGTIRAVGLGTIEFDAPVSKGDSGGPLIDQRETIVGVVVRRSVPEAGKQQQKFAIAIDARALRQFIPELLTKGIHNSRHKKLPSI